jgi:hypothetical protein
MRRITAEIHHFNVGFCIGTVCQFGRLWRPKLIRRLQDKWLDLRPISAKRHFQSADRIRLPFAGIRARKKIDANARFRQFRAIAFTLHDNRICSFIPQVRASVDRTLNTMNSRDIQIKNRAQPVRLERI